MSDTTEQFRGGDPASHYMRLWEEAKERIAALEAERDRLRGVLEHARGAGSWATMQEIVRDVTDVSPGSGENDEHREMRP